MYPTNAAYQAAIQQRSREWKLKLKISLDSGAVYDLTEDDIVLDSCTFTESAFCSDSLQVGSTYANGLDFTLLNRDGRFNDDNFQSARVTCEFGLRVAESGEEAFYFVPMGAFNVTEAGKKHTTIPIKTLDDMYRLNKPVSALGVLPSDLPTFMTVLAGACGVTLSSTLSAELPSVSCDLTALPVEDMTCRDFVSYVGALLGKNMRFNRSNELESYWYGPTVYSTTADNRMEGFTMEDLSVQVTSVTIQDRYENSYTMPEDADAGDYAIVMDPNPLITTEDQAADALAAIYDHLTLTAYRPYECPYWGDPSIQAGDLISHTVAGSEAPVTSIITKHELNFAGFGTLYAEGEPAEANRQMTATAKKLSESRVTASKDLNDTVQGINRDLINQAALITNSMGFYLDYDIDPVTGAFTRFWMMDAKEPSEATIIWRISEDGVQVSHDHGETFQSGWTADDTIVAHVISANMIKTGALRSQDSTLHIDLENGDFRAQTQTGSTEISGHTVCLFYKQNAEDINLSQLVLSADRDASEQKVDMRVSFASLDPDSTVQSSIFQRFDIDEETDEISAVEPLTIMSTLPIRVEQRLEVADAIVYDKIMMQRKASETGNTGVDFVLMEG